ncbi:hypothetical protein LEP1GSC133_4515 [Leptospira borgpetersenii serovar Pomona str. 200901868]|uniref:Uncharacterized protein n=1 Tax=Leptospira borgpetersenii serovar Pomona str. 200901868 TaxID=1192866 RepID=M6WCE8_LEPBO|nr:hypothetical protein LEP1GSC133_4515 [Leptospira borgpetersenii serovar Pomona str. 200901868]
MGKGKAFPSLHTELAIFLIYKCLMCFQARYSATPSPGYLLGSIPGTLF